MDEDQAQDAGVQSVEHIEAPETVVEAEPLTDEQKQEVQAELQEQLNDIQPDTPEDRDQAVQIENQIADLQLDPTTGLPVGHVVHRSFGR